MIIDTHVHYNLEPLFSNEEDPSAWKQHWEAAVAADVKKAIIVGTDTFTSKLAAHLANKVDGGYASVGCHPAFYHETYVEALTQGRKIPDALFEDVEGDLIAITKSVELPKVVAVGEVGLDYYRLDTSSEMGQIVMQIQQHAFVQHIQLAKQKKLPLICHIRDRDVPKKKVKNNAYWDALAILQRENVHDFVLHCVSGPSAYVDAAIELGGYMGFDGNITYPNAKPIREIFAQVPADRRVLETDAPYLPPQEFRGKTCEPWMITKTVAYIKEHLHCDPDSFVENAQRLFGI